jgi:hypothetical protein
MQQVGKASTETLACASFSKATCVQSSTLAHCACGYQMDVARGPFFKSVNNGVFRWSVHARPIAMQRLHAGCSSTCIKTSVHCLVIVLCHACACLVFLLEAQLVAVHRLSGSSRPPACTSQLADDDDQGRTFLQYSRCPI